MMRRLILFLSFFACLALPVLGTAEVAGEEDIPIDPLITVTSYDGDISTTVMSRFVGWAVKEDYDHYVLVRTGQYTYSMVLGLSDSSLSFSGSRFLFSGPTKVAVYDTRSGSVNNYISTWTVTNDTNTVVTSASNSGYVYSSFGDFPSISELESFEDQHDLLLYVIGCVCVLVASCLFSLITRWMEVVHEH